MTIVRRSGNTKLRRSILDAAIPIVFYHVKTGVRMQKAFEKDCEADRLYEAFALLRTPKEARAFLFDIATPGEIATLADRWRIAAMLDTGAMTYREIAAATGASTATIVRVAKFLRERPFQGYRLALDRLATKGAPDHE